MSSSSLNAPIAIAIVCQAISPFTFHQITWTEYGVDIGVSDPATRVAMAERLGLAASGIAPDGALATADGVYADVPVKVWGRPSEAEVVAWALARAGVTS